MQTNNNVIYSKIMDHPELVSASNGSMHCIQYDRNRSYSYLEPFASSMGQSCYPNFGYNFLPAHAQSTQLNFIDNNALSERSAYTDIQTCIKLDKPHDVQSICNEQKKRGRKTKNEINISRQENKLNRNSNKRYYNYKGIEVKPREFLDYQCKCIKKCSLKLKSDERKTEFEKFWALSAYDAQTAYIAAKVSEHPVKRRYGKNNQIKKDFSRIYSLCSATVCRDMFCKTLQISSGRINTALTKIRKRTAISDQRGMKKQPEIIISMKNNIKPRKTSSENLHTADHCTQENIKNSLHCSSQDNVNSLLKNTEITSLNKKNLNVTTTIDMCSVIYTKTRDFLIEDNSNPIFTSTHPKHHSNSSKGKKLKYIQTREANKLNRNSNKPYINYKGLLVEPKEFIDFKCKCSKKCYQNSNVIDRYTEFEKFWTLPYNSQTVYIVAAVTEQPVKRRYAQQNVPKKDFSRKYSLGAVNVCREMFCRTLHISPGRINTALKKYRTKSALLDQRGLKQGGHNRLPSEKKSNAVRFLKRIPVYKSHYSREKTRARFLPPELTLTRLYDLYKEEEKDNAISNASFKKIFYNSFNFKSKETCYLCNTLKNTLKKEQNCNRLTQVKEKYERHHAIAEKVQKYLDHDMLLAKKYPEIECITLEMGRMLPLPRIPHSNMCYKRLLWLYNLSIFSSKKEQSYCYVWPEGQAGKGAQEVGSCILKHAKEDILWSPEVSHIIIWTDAYCGLNRNFKLIIMLKCLLHSYPSLKSIKIKFLDSAHCNIPNHRDFNDIEKVLKTNNPLFLPNDYINVMRHCRKKKPLIVKSMSSHEFLSTEQLEQHILLNSTFTDALRMNWAEILEVALYSDQPFRIHFKTDLEGESNVIDISNNCHGQSTMNLIHMLVPLWPSGRPITPAKLKDLKSVLHLMPTDAKNFYLSLHCGTGNEEDVDGLNEQLDFEIENNFV